MIYNEEFETLPREALKALQVKRLQRVRQRGYQSVVLYKKSLDAAKISPYDFRSLEDLKKIPVQLNDPIMVFESESHPQTSFVIMTEITDQDGDTVIVAIHLDKQVGRHVVNDIASIYGKDEDRWFQNQILKGNC